MNLNKIKSLYPFLFVFYPFLVLYSNNLYLFSFSDVLPLVLASLGATALLFLLFRILLGNYWKSGIMTSYLILVFFSWGHIFDLVLSVGSNLSPMSKTTLLVSFLVLIPSSLFIILFLYLMKSKSRPVYAEEFLRATSLFLIIISLFNIGAKLARYEFSFSSARVIETEKNILDFGNQETESLPSIYHIVLDGYARQDILKEVYDYDNSGFLSCLEEKGFYVARESRSNYCQSCLSVASFLNFEYIDPNLAKGSQDRSPLAEMIRNNKAALFLKEKGYRFVNFPIGYFCINKSPLADLNVDTGSVLSDRLFQNVFFHTTALRPFLSKKNQVEEKTGRILNVFASLKELSKTIDPLYVYAHVVAPHPPFVFGPNGEKIIEGNFCMNADGDWWVGRCGTEEEYIKGYRNQLIYTNKLVCETIDEILKNSKEPPIIILQADHGPGAKLKWEDPEETYMEERMGILNAYLLPGISNTLYDSITPVNTYRVIFNSYFGTDYNLLEDRSYFSTWSEPYRFIEVD